MQSNLSCNSFHYQAIMLQVSIAQSTSQFLRDPDPESKKSKDFPEANKESTRNNTQVKR